MSIQSKFCSADLISENWRLTVSSSLPLSWLEPQFKFSLVKLGFMFGVTSFFLVEGYSELQSRIKKWKSTGTCRTSFWLLRSLAFGNSVVIRGWVAIRTGKKPTLDPFLIAYFRTPLADTSSVSPKIARYNSHKLWLLFQGCFKSKNFSKIRLLYFSNRKAKPSA